MTKTKTRSYTRDYPIGEKPGRYLIEAPAPLWRKVKAKAKRDGLSIRSVMLTFLEEWSADARCRHGNIPTACPECRRTKEK